MISKLRMSGRDHAALLQHLFPGDHKEAVAIAICGVADSKVEEVVTVHKLKLIPHHICDRNQDYISWPVEVIVELLNEAAANRMRILKIHSHPAGYPYFSKTDDDSDYHLFRTASEWLETDSPGLSAIMFPDGSIKARTVSGDGSFSDVQSIMVAGDDIRYFSSREESDTVNVHNAMERTAQTFGRRTTSLLSHLSIGVVGVSGTGSPVVELLYRSGVGELVLVDGDVMEERNLNRIMNSTMADALESKPKVLVAAEAIVRSGLPAKVIPLMDSLFTPSVVKRLAHCDIIFGCMDSVEGRHVLNTLCNFYCIPYFDLGIGLAADGFGGISRIGGNAHYLQPGGSSLLTRKVITGPRLTAESLKRTAPQEYEKRRGEGYIAGVNESSPAVISVNTLIASLAVNDFLARIHPYRSEDNDAFSVISMDLLNWRMIADTPDGEPDLLFQKTVGRGHITPLLCMPMFNEGESYA